MIAALGWAGSALVVLSLVQTDVRRLRQISLASALVLGAFNLLVVIPSMIALNVVLAFVNTYHLLVNRRRTLRAPVADPNELQPSNVEGAVRCDSAHEEFGSRQLVGR